MSFLTTFTRAAACAALSCVLCTAVEAQYFQHHYGNALDNAFTKVIPHGPNYYVIGRDQPTAGVLAHATVARINGSGQLQWVLRLDLASQWNDAVLTPTGNLIMVGNTLPFDASSQSLLGIVTPAGVLSLAQTLNVPGRDWFNRIVRNPTPENANFPYYILGGQWEGGTTSATWDDIVLLTINAAGAIGWKKVYKGPFGSTDDEFARDLKVLPNGDLLLAGNVGSGGVLFRGRNTGDIENAVGPDGVSSSFTFADVAPVNNGFLALGNTFPTFQAYLMKFDTDLLPVWQVRLPQLTTVRNVWQADSSIYVSGSAPVGGLTRGVVLRFFDAPGGPVLRWMKYLHQNETAYAGGGAWPVSSVQVAYADGRIKPNGFGGECAFLSVSDPELNSCMTLTAAATVAISNFSFNSPVAFNPQPAPTPTITDITSQHSLIAWQEAEACAKICRCPSDAFKNMSYRPISGPNVPIDCGEVAIWECRFPAFNLGGEFMCEGSLCPPTPSMSWVLNHPTLGQVDNGATNGPGFQISIPNSSFPLPGLYTLTLTGICENDTCYCEILIETPGCAGYNCSCKKKEVIFSSTGGASIAIPCEPDPPFPVFFCPTAPVTISSNFGCVDINGNPCPATPPYPPIDWILYGPNGIIQQGSITTGAPWALSFTAADLAGSGFFTLDMTTFCPGEMDSCKCIATWFQECITCVCGPKPWNSEIRYGGAQNQAVNCGDTLNVTQGSAFYPNFVCQGPPNCGRVDWTLTGPNGYVQGMVGVVPNANGDFVIPPLSPTNFPFPGTYCLQMLGICGQDTCPCVIYFCLPPSQPYVDDASICRTLQSAYIPLQDCPTDCDIAQVQWFVKPCSASNWPLWPYQISSAGNSQSCDDLLFLPYQYPNEACVQVYAVINLAPGCCVPGLTTNIATIDLCDPIACSIDNPNMLGICQSGQPLPLSLSGTLSGTNCSPTVEWYDENNQLVSTGLTYTPPVLTFPSSSTACYKDFIFTMKVIGICGTSSCSTTIRVFNINSDNGDLKMDPLEGQPFYLVCPGEDARLVYFDLCSGPPPKWQWYESTVSGSSGFVGIAGAGMTNTVYYTNQLYQTTWFMVESQNGVCPPQQDVLKIEVKDALQVTSFTAVPDPCISNQAVLTVGFTPSPITGAGCQYIVDWYHNDNLIHTSTASSSPVSYTHFGPTIPGVYYAIVRDNCCLGAVQTWPQVINSPCVPKILGPCYKCDMTTPAMLFGEMVLPPQDDCPSNVVCTYQWYVKDVLPHPDVWVLLPGETNSTLSILKGGHYKLETTCDYGYGNCFQSDSITVAQCMGCIYVGDEEIPMPSELNVIVRPNPTAGDVNIQISPATLRRGRVEIVDINGRGLVSSQIPEGQSSVAISLAKLSSGLYFVRVHEGDVLLWIGKIVKNQ